MEIHPESRTALAVASIRAYHYRNDTALIFSDPVAHQLVSAEEEEFFANGRCERLKRLQRNPSLRRAPDRPKHLASFRD